VALKRALNGATSAVASGVHTNSSFPTSKIMKKLFTLIVPLMLVLAVNIYYRAFPVNFPQLKEQAKNLAEGKIYQEAALVVDKSFPGYYSSARNQLIKAFVAQYKKDKKAAIKKEIGETYAKLKDNYQDPSGSTYLMELDCWHWARYVENVLKHGYPGDKIVNAKQWDTFMFAPSGTATAWNDFLYYFSAFLYKIFSLFKNVALFHFLFYLPLFFAIIFISLLYLFCFYRFGTIAAITSSLFIGLAPIFLFRSCAGWFDSDIFQLAFPLLIVWAYLKAYEAASFKTIFSWLCFSAFWAGLFCFTWLNWWFIFLIIVFYEIYYLVNAASTYLQYKIKDTPALKKHLFNSAIFIFFSLFWIVLFCGFAPLAELYSQIKRALTLNASLLTTSIWPNVYSTVGELRKARVADIAGSIGGLVLIIASLISTLALFLYTLRKKKDTTDHALILIIVFWLLSMSFACLRGLRFSMFLLLPLGISLGWAFAEGYAYLKKRQMKLRLIMAILVMISFGIKFFINADLSARRIFPLMDDSWYRVLTTIRETTPKEAVINSWWDFGDWFKVAAGRPVIFDGQSQNTPQGYWMARVLLANSEEEAVRILRMLNNGGNRAFEIINAQFKDSYRSIFLLEKLLSSDRQTVEESLLKLMPPEPAAEVSNLLFSQPGKAYFIVDYTMQDKITQIAFLGNWDFIRTYIVNNLNKTPKPQIEGYLSALGVDSNLTQRFYQEASLLSSADSEEWISRRLSFRNRLVAGQRKDNIVFFDNGLIYNLGDQKTSLYSFREYQYKIPFSLFSAEGNRLKEIVYPDSNLDVSVLLLRNDSGYQSILLDRDLAQSLFVRLYFLGGKDLKHFKLFTEDSAGGNYIRVFEIVW
jgi:asparagine N-glycosylation enzyme membrane subunit Stt3